MLSFSAFRAKLQQGGGVLLFLHGGAWKVDGVPVLFLGIHCNRAAGCCCSFMVGVEGGRGAGAVPGHPLQQGGGALLFLHGGRGRCAGCRCCSLASIATGRRITLARAMFHGLFPARCARTQNARKLCEMLHPAENFAKYYILRLNALIYRQL